MSSACVPTTIRCCSRCRTAWSRSIRRTMW
jgi:hypothetical protein